MARLATVEATTLLIDGCERKNEQREKRTKQRKFKNHRERKYIKNRINEIKTINLIQIETKNCRKINKEKGKNTTMKKELLIKELLHVSRISNGIQLQFTENRIITITNFELSSFDRTQLDKFIAKHHQLEIG